MRKVFCERILSCLNLKKYIMIFLIFCLLEYLEGVLREKLRGTTIVIRCKLYSFNRL